MTVTLLENHDNPENKKFKIRLWEILSEWEVQAKDKEEAEKKGWGQLDPRLDACDFKLDVEEVED